MQPQQCRGMCLERTWLPNVFQRLKPCPNNCQLTRCPNYRICGSVCEQREDSWMKYCLGCAMSYNTTLGMLDMSTDGQCGVCLEKKREFVCLPDCSHNMCISCFKRDYKVQYVQQEPRVIELGQEELLNELYRENARQEKLTPHYVSIEEQSSVCACPFCKVVSPTPSLLYTTSPPTSIQPQECRGACLSLVSFGEIVYNSNVYHRARPCISNCQPVRCPNYRVCSGAGPEHYLDGNRGFCLYCHMLLDISLTFLNNPDGKRCGVCSETKKEFVVLLMCKHYLCILCFRRQYNLSWLDEEPRVVEGEQEQREPEVPQWNRSFHTKADGSKGPDYLNECPFCRATSPLPWNN